MALDGVSQNRTQATDAAQDAGGQQAAAQQAGNTAGAENILGDHYDPSAPHNESPVADPTQASAIKKMLGRKDLPGIAAIRKRHKFLMKKLEAFLQRKLEAASANETGGSGSSSSSGAGSTSSAGSSSAGTDATQTSSGTTGADATATDGTTTTDTSQTSTRTSPGDIDLGVNPIAQSGNTDCESTARQMAAQTGATPQGWTNCIQLAESEDASGHVEVDPAKLEEGLDYIDSELAAGRAVVVGVSFCDQETTSLYHEQTGTANGTEINADQMSDHFVTITGTTTIDGQTAYLFADPATGQESAFFVEDGKLVRAGEGLYSDDGTQMTGSWTSAWYEVTMIERNAESG